jgi:hypothetical protein
MCPRNFLSGVTSEARAAESFSLAATGQRAMPKKLRLLSPWRRLSVVRDGCWHACTKKSHDQVSRPAMEALLNTWCSEIVASLSEALPVMNMTDNHLAE